MSGHSHALLGLGHGDVERGLVGVGWARFLFGLYARWALRTRLVADELCSRFIGSFRQRHAYVDLLTSVPISISCNVHRTKPENTSPRRRDVKTLEIKSAVACN